MPADPPKLTAEEVIAGYRLILGRPPESEAVVEQHRHAHADLEAFGQTLARSAEFAARGFFPGMPPPREAGPLEIETAAGAQGLAQLMAGLAEHWEGLGETAPHWSVLADPRFAPERIAETRAEFYATGQDELRLVEATLARIGRTLAAGVAGACATQLPGSSSASMAGRTRIRSAPSTRHRRRGRGSRS